MVSVDEPTRLYTVGQIAREHGVPITRVVYVVRSRNVRAVCKAGNIRLFDEASACRIRRELDRIASKREATPCN